MNGIIINTPEISEFLNKCSTKGVTVKYNSEATKITLKEVKNSSKNIVRWTILFDISFIILL